jgi:hypothetical protein
MWGRCHRIYMVCIQLGASLSGEDNNTAPRHRMLRLREQQSFSALGRSRVQMPARRIGSQKTFVVLFGLSR